MSDLVVLVNGAEYRGWKTVAIQKSLDDFVPSFSVSYTESWPPKGGVIPSVPETPDPVLEGDAVVLKYKGAKLLTGYIDEVTEEYGDSGGESTHTFGLTGRAKTCDLVDCSASVKTSIVRGKTVLDICTRLCEPFGIGVGLDPALLFDSDIFEPVERFKLQEGETPFEAMSRLTRKRGLLAITDAYGDVLLTRSASVPSGDIIRSGVNVLRAKRVGSARDRFSDYVFKSQRSADDSTNGSAAAQLKASVTDSEVTRYRPTVVIAEHQSNAAELKARATWQRNTAAGRSERYSYTVKGWEALSGVWDINTTPTVADDDFGIYEPLLIAALELSSSDSEGDVAHVEVCGVGAYDMLTAPKRRKRAS